MIDRHTKRVVTLILTTILLVLSGCGKQEDQPAPAPAGASAPEAAEEGETQAAEAADQEAGKPVLNVGNMMAGVDKNGDGKVTREEYGAIWKDKAHADRNFKMIDRNGDGVLSAEEFMPKLGTK